MRFIERAVELVRHVVDRGDIFDYVIDSRFTMPRDRFVTRIVQQEEAVLSECLVGFDGHRVSRAARIQHTLLGQCAVRRCQFDLGVPLEATALLIAEAHRRLIIVVRTSQSVPLLAQVQFGL